MSDLQVDLYATFDRPYPFKRKEDIEPLLIYPALMKDFYFFQYFAGCLKIDKNSIPDVKIISMSYLEYLIREHMKAEKEGVVENQYLAHLNALLSIVLKKESLEFKYGFDEKKKSFLILDGVKYNQHDFEKIRQVIAEMNLVELPNELIQKKLRDKLEEAEELRRKIRGTKMAPLEDQMVALSIATGISMNEIYEMPIRKFIKAIERVDHKLHYEIMLSASMSGFVEFKNKNAIKHWLVDLKKDPLAGAMDMDELEKKIA